MQESGGPGFKTRGLQSVLRRTCSYQGHHMESLYNNFYFNYFEGKRCGIAVRAADPYSTPAELAL